MFERESNDFSDILSDPAVKPHITHKLLYDQHLMLGLEDNDFGSLDGVLTYVLLKYGDSHVDTNQKIPDRSPVIFKDYFPKRKPRNNQE